jgi:nitrogen fixation-related uncharacterized protein
MMKRIFVFIVVAIIVVSIIIGCLFGIDNGFMQKVDTDKGHSIDSQVAEGMGGEGYAFLHTVKKGGFIS